MATFSPDTLVQGNDGNPISVMDGVKAGWYKQDANGDVVIPEGDTPNVYLPNGSVVGFGLAASSNGLNARSNAPTPATSSAPVSEKDLTGARASAGAAANLLKQYNLDELSPYIDQIARGLLTWEELQVQLYDPATAPGRVVDKMYPELQLARKKAQAEGRNPDPLSIADVLTFKQQGRQLISTLGFSDAFPNLEQTLSSWIVDGKSLVEQNKKLSDISDYAVHLASTDPVAVAETKVLTDYYGVAPTKADLVTFALTNDEPLLHKRLEAASAGAAAQTSGYGAIGVGQAENLASLGVSADQARQGFSQLAQMAELFNPLPGQPGDAISQDEQLGAEFGGNAAAQRRIKRTQQERTAGFQGGGSIVSSRDGFIGAGSAA